MGRRNQNRTRCRRLLLRSCSSSWWGHTPGHKGGPSEGPSVGHPACPKTAKGANATRTTQEALEDLEDSHLGNSGFPLTIFNNILPGKPVQTRTLFPVSKFCK